LHKKAGQDMKPDTKLMAAIIIAINAYLQSEQSNSSLNAEQRGPLSGQPGAAPALK
jgi:hypothetical protein